MMSKVAAFAAWRRLWPLRSRRDLRYHFIHIPKNAGQAVRAALVRRRDVSLTEPLHSRYVDVVESVGDQLRYFCIVRNPWARTASRYLFARQSFHKWPGTDPRRLYMEHASFSDFVRDQKVFDIPQHPGQPWMGPMNSWFDQLEWISDRNGKVCCDCLRLERLETDLAEFFGEHIEVPKKNVTKTSYDYRSMYDDDLRDIVARRFAKDVAHFGFTFDGGATRNVVGL